MRRDKREGWVGGVVASVCTVSKKVRDYTSGIPLNRLREEGGWKTSGINSLTFDSATPVIPAVLLSLIRTVYILLTCLVCRARPSHQTLDCVCKYGAESNSKRRVQCERVADVGVRPIHHKDISSLWG